MVAQVFGRVKSTNKYSGILYLLLIEYYSRLGYTISAQCACVCVCNGVWVVKKVATLSGLTQKNERIPNELVSYLPQLMSKFSYFGHQFYSVGLEFYRSSGRMIN